MNQGPPTSRDREGPLSRPPADATGHLLYIATVALTVRYFLVPLADRFRSQGWRVAAAARGATTDDVLIRSFDEIHELPLSRSILDVGGIAAGYRALVAILETGPDIVHLHSPIASFLARLAARRLPLSRRPAIVYTVHGFHFYRGGSPITNALFVIAEKLAGRWTDRLIVINDEDYEAARRHGIVAADRLVRMPGIGIDTDLFRRSGVDPAAVTAVNEALGRKPGCPVFVVVAELTARKRNFDVIRALARMERRDAILVIAGAGPQQQLLERLAARLQVDTRVRMVGQIADVRALVVAATAMILASDREGLSRAIMEALALEVPVIASTARGNAELVEDSGLLFPTGDVDALAASMDWMASHREDGEAMGRRGRQRMQERYELRDIARRHEELYSDLMAIRRRPPS